MARHLLVFLQLSVLWQEVLPWVHPKTCAHTHRSWSRSLSNTDPHLESENSTVNLLLSSNEVDGAEFWRLADEMKPGRSKVKLLFIPTAAMYLDPDSPSTRTVNERRSRQRGNLRKRLKRIVAGLQGVTGSDATSEGGMDHRAIEAEFLDLSDPKVTAADTQAAFETESTDLLAVLVDGGNTWCVGCLLA